MTGRWFILSALLAPVSLAAQSYVQGEPIVLWDGLSSATTKAEAKRFMAALPDRRVAIMPGCDAAFIYQVRKGTLVSVILVVRENLADCRSRVETQLRSQLGEPEVGSAVHGSVLAFGDGDVLDTTSQGLKLTWREGEKKTKLIDTTKNSFNLIVTVREDKYLY